MWHLHTGQSLDGLDPVTAHTQKSEGGKVDVGDLLNNCRPFIIIYIIHNLHKMSFLAEDWVSSLTFRLTYSVHFPSK